MLRFAVFLLLSFAASAQFKIERAGDPPSDLAPVIRVTLSKAGTKIENNTGSTLAEIWMRATAPRNPPALRTNLAPPGIPSGSLVGAVRLAGKGSDMRGQAILPGSYTLRYLGAYVNTDPAHRDYVLLLPAALDKSTRTITQFQTLLDQSRKASGTTNPAMFGFWKAGADFKPGLFLSGPSDWVVQTKLGDVPICLLMGQTE